MLGPIFQCAICSTVFTQAMERHYLGEVDEVCPNPTCGAESVDWDHYTDPALRHEFYAIIGESFTEARRINLSAIAEQMGPFNNLHREL